MLKPARCNYCDGGCVVRPVEKDGKISLEPLDPNFPAICSKAVRWNEISSFEDRVTHPLENIGKRGEPVWQEISWDEALDKIAERLQLIIDEYGPEAIAFSEHPLNHGFGGITRRFMNHIGSPNYITPLDLCMGNTAQVHRATYGWFTSPIWDKTDCIIYFGQNRGPCFWPEEFLNLKAALKRGARLIVIDPRKTETAEMADYYLQINCGTDAAFALALISTIIEEELYDKEFVCDNTLGFSELADRVRDYTPEKMAQICGIEASRIREVARIYASAEAAIIPWGVTGDMQKNSTSLLRCQCILRAICGFINKSEMVFGPASGIVTMSALSDFEALPEEKRKIQLGMDHYPLFSFKGGSLYDARMKDEGIVGYQDLFACAAMAHPPTVFTAMREEKPYPIKAMFCIANNTIMSYANMQGIIDGFMNLDLVVAYEVNLTPTAQLADFVLPGDLWVERTTVGPVLDAAPTFTASFGFTKAPKDCKDWYFVVKGLADRLGIGSAFPWANSDELRAYLFKEANLTEDDLSEKLAIPVQAPHLGKFLTPSGKIELKSSVLEALGYDPLPYYEEINDPSYNAEEYPYVIFSGSREAGNYNTNLHQIAFLRKLNPDPTLFINPYDAENEGIVDGQWVQVITTHGKVELIVKLDESLKPGTLRVPHGWWKPECAGGLANDLSKSLLYNDGMLFSDADWNLDKEQGLANLRGGIHAKIEALT